MQNSHVFINRDDRDNIQAIHLHASGLTVRDREQVLQLIDCNHADHAVAILQILNHEILHSTSLYDYQPRSAESMSAWFNGKQSRHDPIIGAVDDDGTLLGFATYGPFRAWAAYKYTVEHSIYVRAERRGNGIGHRLLLELISRARSQDYHTLIGGVDLNNAASIALHRKHGFQHAGTIRQAAFKFGRWLDLAFYQLILETPAAPKDS